MSLKAMLKDSKQNPGYCRKNVSDPDVSDRRGVARSSLDALKDHVARAWTLSEAGMSERPHTPKAG